MSEPRINESRVDPGTPQIRFDFAHGPQRGTHLLLYPACLVHRGDAHLETVPFAAVAAVRVSFQRDLRRIGWGVALVIVALLLLLISAPLSALAASWASEISSAGPSGVSRGLLAFFHFIGAVASMLPAAGLACALAGAGLGALGWLGDTTLALALPGAERVYSTRGRDSRLLDFAEALSERIMARDR